MRPSRLRSMTRSLLRLTLPVALLFSCHYAHAQMSLGDSFQVSPFKDYKVITTEHFRIVFSADVKTQAKRAAELYEEAHEALKTELSWEPGHLVNVLLLDNTDAANGLASPISRFGMILYLTPPESWFSIGYYDDWLKMVIFHEYTHYLNMDATRGAYDVLRKFFGDVLLPNALWPTWMLEGLAVFIETKHTKRGRGRSPFYEMVLRTAVLRKKLNKSEYITLDQINGRRPRAPYGETPYLFGYQLLSKIERTQPDTLNQLTTRSSYRFPYFINGNLSNITGKDFYSFWEDWVAETYQRQNENITILNRESITQTKPFADITQNTLGSALSPDGKWLAFTRDPDNKWQALYLKHLPSGEVTEIEDKFLGVGMSFTPDSKHLIYSSLHRLNSYNFFSDLKSYHLESKTSSWLTHALRAKDPGVSPDGTRITFTITHKSAQNLAIANIRISDKSVTILPKSVTRLTSGNIFDRVSSPIFSHDNLKIYYSFKKTGALGEDLMVYHLDRGVKDVLVTNNHMNRFPCLGPGGLLTFISDVSGVENLYALNAAKQPVQLTNTLTGITLPSYHPSLGFVASVYDYTGYGLATFTPKLDGYPTERLTVRPPPLAPPPETTPKSYSVSENSIQNYTPFSSLLPRQWAPILLLQPSQTYVGAQVFGYDTALQHQYFLFGAYDSFTRKGDGNIRYSNRMLGVNLTFDVLSQTTDLFGDPSVEGSQVNYVRKNAYGVTASFPFQYTVGSLTPSIGLRNESNSEYQTSRPGESSLVSKSSIIPTQLATLVFKNTRTSDFAVAPERGIRLFGGVKRYDIENEETYKFMGKLASYHEVYPEGVLSPSLRGIVSSRENASFFDSNAILRGRRQNLLSPFVENELDQAPIRGYPRRSFSTQAVYTGALDFATPITQIFRGWGTNPLFFDNMALFAFYENTYFPYGEYGSYLQAAGTGLRLNTEWFMRLPVSFGADYHQGFNRTQGGKGEFFFGIYLTSTPFAL